MGIRLTFWLGIAPMCAVLEAAPVPDAGKDAAPAKEVAVAGRSGSAVTPSPAAHPMTPAELLRTVRDRLPPPAPGISDIAFEDFFKMPVGPKGLEVSPKLAALHGQRVRVVGYMVKQARPTPFTLMLCHMPLVSNEVEYGLAEDLPASVVRVILPRTHQPIPPHTRGIVLAEGRLEVGNQEEPDGRHSMVRLHADGPLASVSMAKATNGPTTGTPPAVGTATRNLSTPGATGR